MNTCGFNFDNTYTALPAPFYKFNSPTRFPSAQVVIINHKLAERMGLDFSHLTHTDQASLFSGNVSPATTEPFSQAYAGHQFGNFTILGDGRAHMMGEHLTPAGERLDIQFKGSGTTPYSRRGDGLAAIGPMLREYIISEAIHHLGISTSRSLAVVATGEGIMRDRAQPGAILTRVADSHIRVGTFEYAAATKNLKLSSSLLDYTINRHYPELADSETKALSLIEAVMHRQIRLIVDWMRVGFIHGVMNTDNVALSGESIDFGPCAFMDSYDPNTVFSSIDQHGRYAYSNQPTITQWNLARLAESLLPLIDEDIERAVEQAKEVIYQFSGHYDQAWLTMMRLKLGLKGEHDDDKNLIDSLLEWMHQNNLDFTNTFRDLSHPDAPKGSHYSHPVFIEWYQKYSARRITNRQSVDESVELMSSVNPAVIPRNHQVERVLEIAETGDLLPLHSLLKALESPYQDLAEYKPFQLPPEITPQGYQTFCGT